jgi:hypothetical protein
MTARYASFVLAVSLVAAIANAGGTPPPPSRRLAQPAPVGSTTFGDSIRSIPVSGTEPIGPGASLRARAAPGGLAAGDPAALQAVIHLLAAYDSKELTAFSRLLTDDFQFHSGGTPDEPSFVFNREDKIASARHLFEGVVGPSGERLPAARRITVSAGPFHVRPDPERDDPQGRFMLVFALHVAVEIEFEDGSTVRKDSVPHLFHLVRGDAALLGAGVQPTAGEWFVHEWTEGPAPLVATQPAPSRSASTAASTAPAADTVSAPTDSAGVAGFPLGIAPLENPARGVIALRLSLPGQGQARLEAFDVAGRRVMSREFAAERGARRMTIEPGPAMRAGVYWLRLSQGRRRVTSRLVLVE